MLNGLKCTLNGISQLGQDSTGNCVYGECMCGWIQEYEYLIG